MTKLSLKATFYVAKSREMLKISKKFHQLHLFPLGKGFNKIFFENIRRQIVDNIQSKRITAVYGRHISNWLRSPPHLRFARSSQCRCRL